MRRARRWRRAQEYEQNFWERKARQIESKCLSQLGWYDWKAREFERLIASVDAGRVREDEGTRILEIGSGPVGIVSYLPWGDLFAIDPLEDFYKNTPALIELRNHKVTYIAGAGEDLPYEGKSFSIVIIDNVLDHTRDPGKVLNEACRVLNDTGLLYLTLNVRTNWGARFHRVIALLEIDQGHPYSFTQSGIGECLTTYGFSVVLENVEDYALVHERNRRSYKTTDRLKSYLGLSEYLYTAVCRKCFL